MRRSSMLGDTQQGGAGVGTTFALFKNEQIGQIGRFGILNETSLCVQIICTGICLKICSRQVLDIFDEVSERLPQNLNVHFLEIKILKANYCCIILYHICEKVKF